MKKVLVVDWLDKYGGAERVISSLCNVFSFEKCYVLINIMDKKNTAKVFSNQSIPVQETGLKYFGSKFRYLLLLFPFIIRNIKIEKEVDVIISSSHAIAKGIRKSRKDQIHISYFQARNLKYIWSDYKLYFGKLRYLFYPLILLMRKSDVRAAQNPDYIISNSNFVKEWVKKTYDRDSVVIYPPVDLSNFKLEENKEDYYVAVGRLEPYKRFDIIVKAFNKTNKNIIIIGDGTVLKDLKNIANKNIKFVGFLESKEVFHYISKAKGFVHAGIEDFGIAPIEAQACGTPVIAYGFGGVLETIIENKTGVFFREENDESLLEAINVFEKIDFCYKEISKNAERFHKSNFETQINKFISEKIKNN